MQGPTQDAAFTPRRGQHESSFSSVLSATYDPAMVPRSGLRLAGCAPLGGVLFTALVTAGPTREHLDDVRFLANGSSGRMGYAVAEALSAAGCRVHLVSGPVDILPPHGVELHPVISALEMQAEVEKLFPGCDLVFAVAAGADYRPRTRQHGKPPKSQGGFSIELVPNPDIVAALGRKKVNKVLVGFALESGSFEAARARGHAKLVAKGLDMIVVNLASTLGAPDVEAWVLTADGREKPLPRAAKSVLAVELVREALALVRSRREGIVP